MKERSAPTPEPSVIVSYSQFLFTFTYLWTVNSWTFFHSFDRWNSLFHSVSKGAGGEEGKAVSPISSCSSLSRWLNSFLFLSPVIKINSTSLPLTLYSLQKKVQTQLLINYQSPNWRVRKEDSLFILVTELNLITCPFLTLFLLEQNSNLLAGWTMTSVCAFFHSWTRSRS